MYQWTSGIRPGLGHCVVFHFKATVIGWQGIRLKISLHLYEQYKQSKQSIVNWTIAYVYNTFVLAFMD